MGKIEDIDLINYIVNQEKTAQEAAEYFEVSLSTIRKRLASIKASLKDDSEISKQLLSVINNNQNKGRIKGGQSLNSGSSMNVDMETIVEYAKKIIAYDMTINEASLMFNVPSSTLHEQLEHLANSEYSDIYCDLQNLFSYHKKYINKPLTTDLFKLQQKYTFLLENNDKKM